MPPIRTMFFTVLVLMILAYAGILFIGGYETGNGLTLNTTYGIASNYNAITNNAIGNTGLFSNTTALQQQTNKSSLNQINYSASSLAALGGAVSSAATLITSIPRIFTALLQFVAAPLQVLGIPSSYAIIIAGIIIIGTMVLAILSAIFLFPI